MLNYPPIDLITSFSSNLGPAAQIYKVDISPAFRQMKIDPADIDLLGLKFQDQYYIDRLISFGHRNGSQIFRGVPTPYGLQCNNHGFPYLF